LYIPDTKPQARWFPLKVKKRQPAGGVFCYWLNLRQARIRSWLISGNRFDMRSRFLKMVSDSFSVPGGFPV
jgi:hypothetical protein